MIKVKKISLKSQIRIIKILILTMKNEGVDDKRLRTKRRQVLIYLSYKSTVKN
jgi:hypothetical protein